jgi:hypothetical protein
MAVHLVSRGVSAGQGVEALAVDGEELATRPSTRPRASRSTSASSATSPYAADSSSASNSFVDTAKVREPMISDA